MLSTTDGKVEVSFARSKVNESLSDDASSSISIGDIAKAYVSETNKKGCFLRLKNGMRAKVLIKDLADTFVADPAASFPSGRLVAGKVTKVHKGTGMVDLNMRESVLIRDEDRIVFDEIEKGDKLPGVVTRIEAYGVFVKFLNSDVSGLVHITELSDNYVEDISKLYSPGDIVKALVLNTAMEGEKPKVSLGLKQSYFVNDDEGIQVGGGSSSSGSDSDSDGDSDGEGDATDSESDVDSSSGDGEGSLSGEEGIAAMDVDEDDNNSLNSDDSNFMEKLQSRMSEGDKSEEDNSGSDDSGDSSDGDINSDDEESSSEESEEEEDVGFDFERGNKRSGAMSDSSDSDSDDQDPKSRKSRMKKNAKKEREAAIALREEQLASGEADLNPQSPGDFERLLAAEPNSSELWIRYMAFHLAAADHDAARAVADKAVNRIDYTMEEEKLNVYMSVIALELAFGTDGSLQTAISKAARNSNPKRVHLRTAELLEKEVAKLSTASGSRKKEKAAAIERADAHFNSILKKHKSKKKVWLAFCKFLLVTKRSKEANDLLKRAMQSLGQYKHLETVSKFAQMEFEFGSVERGRTIFEGLLEKNKKKLDIWFVYVDKEVKYGSIEKARNIFKKMTGCGGGEGIGIKGDKKMKSVFKKWYNVEEKNGTEKSLEVVTTYAREFVEQSMAQ